MTDKKIITLIRNGNRNRAIRELYNLYPKVKSGVLSNGGTEDDAREIFHDSLVLLIEKVEQPDFELTSKLSTFLYGINHFKWMNEMRKQQKSPETRWSDAIQVSADEVDYDEEKDELLKSLAKVLDTVSEKCKKIITLFYYQKKKMDEIANELEFSSVKSAKTQKYKCMESAIKLGREMVNKNSKVSL